MAVLPFVNDSPNKDNEFFSDGLTEQLISTLSQLPDMRVMGRSTVFRFKGKDDDPPQIGQRLNVDAVLTGRVTQHGDQLNVRTDLVRTADGSDIWGSQYTRKLADLSSLQDEITRDIASKLRSRPTGEQQKQAQRGSTSNSQAYQLYLKGRYYWNRRTVENLKKSIELFQQAIDADPSYALAYAGLADTYNVVSSYEAGISARQAHPLAEAAARKALELDDSLPEAHAAMALAFTNQYKWADAEREFQRSLQLNPNSSATHYFYAFTYLLATGRVDAAMAEIQKALALDPLSPIMNVNYAALLLAAHRYDESLAQFRKALDLDPNFPPAHFKLSQLYATTGRFADAITEWQKFEPTPGSWSADAEGYGRLVAVAELAVRQNTGYEPASFIAYGYAVQGDSAKTFQWLDQAIVEEDDTLATTVRYPLFDSIRSAPRYAEILRRINLQR